MNSIEGIKLLELMYPNFLDSENVKSIPEEYSYEELILDLNKFDSNSYKKDFKANITFGFYEGDLETLRESVKQVEEHWKAYFTEGKRIYCGYIDGKIASFCLIEDKGTYDIDRKQIKIGAPGCVGTLKEFRNMGIGLTMVGNVTQILKDEGYDYSYIHYTSVSEWYKKLGYEITLRWNSNGILEN